MTFRVEWTHQAREDLAGLSPALQERILRKVEAARDGPARFFLRMSNSPLWRLRVGDHRVLADLDAAGRVITVLAVGHRKNVYE